MSFKYRFILSFVTLEIFFILFIVFINFTAITNSSKQLISQRNDSNIAFLEELVKTPMSVYDLATLDNLTHSTTDLNYINSIIILDNSDRLLSSKYNFSFISKEDILKIKENQKFNFSDKLYELIYKEFYEDKVYLGSLYVIFDNSENTIFISQTKKNTFLIIFMEIIISTLLSYFIGYRLTSKLTNLSKIAEDIGTKENIVIPYLDLKDEIGILSRSMNQMQNDLNQRNKILKNLNENLNQQKNELIETQKYKDSFLANMSHELKTPLNSINILSSIMMKNKNDRFNEQDLKNLQIINNSGKNLLILINDILDISKIEAGEVVINPQFFDLNNSIQKMIDMFTVQIRNKGLDFIFKQNKVVNEIYNDEKLINQILVNIIGNAIKFTEKGKIEFSVNDDNDYIEFKVEDEGIGIPEDKIDNIFDRFKQIDAGINRKYGGSGLGLSICKELVLLLNGEINVNSIFGKGTIFTVKIKKNREFIDDSKNRIIIENQMDINKKNLLFYNTKPLEYFDLVIELKRKFLCSVKQITDLELLEKNIDSNTLFILIDFDSVDDVSKLEKMIEKLNNKICLIMNDNTINKPNNVWISCKKSDVLIELEKNV